MENSVSKESMTLSEYDNNIAKLEQDFLDVKGSKCEVYTRIVGYYRATDNWNLGKKSEYKSRIVFNTSQFCNQQDVCKKDSCIDCIKNGTNKVGDFV